MIFSYVEAIIPFNFGIPGVKLGLANVVSVITLSMFGLIPTILVVICRVVLAGLLFGNMYSIIYSLAGALLSVFIMLLVSKLKIFSIYGISMCGGVFHNLGQLIVAVFVIDQLKLSYYGPVLIISGLIMGYLIGLISNQVIKRVETYVR